MMKKLSRVGGPSGAHLLHHLLLLHEHLLDLLHLCVQLIEVDLFSWSSVTCHHGAGHLVQHFCLLHIPDSSSNFLVHSLQDLSTSVHLAFISVYSLSCSSCRVIFCALALPDSRVLSTFSHISFQALQSATMVADSSRLFGDPYPALHFASAPSIQEVKVF